MVDFKRKIWFHPIRRGEGGYRKEKFMEGKRHQEECVGPQDIAVLYRLCLKKRTFRGVNKTSIKST